MISHQLNTKKSSPTAAFFMSARAEDVKSRAVSEAYT